MLIQPNKSFAEYSAFFGGKNEHTPKMRVMLMIGKDKLKSAEEFMLQTKTKKDTKTITWDKLPT